MVHWVPVADASPLSIDSEEIHSDGPDGGPLVIGVVVLGGVLRAKLTVMSSDREMLGVLGDLLVGKRRYVAQDETSVTGRLGGIDNQLLVEVFLDQMGRRGRHPGKRCERLGVSSEEASDMSEKLIREDGGRRVDLLDDRGVSLLEGSVSIQTHRHGMVQIRRSRRQEVVRGAGG